MLFTDIVDSSKMRFTNGRQTDGRPCHKFSSAGVKQSYNDEVWLSVTVFTLFAYYCYTTSRKVFLLSHQPAHYINFIGQVLL